MVWSSTMLVSNPKFRKFVSNHQRNVFPYLFGNKQIWIEKISIFFEASDAEPNVHKIVELWVDEEGRPVRDEKRKCDVHTIHCIATETFPGLFHGVLEIRLGPISEKEGLDLGSLRFEQGIKEVSEIFLIMSYAVDGSG